MKQMRKFKRREMIILKKHKIDHFRPNAKIIPQYMYGKNSANGLRCRGCKHSEFVTVNGHKTYVCNARKNAKGEVCVIRLNFFACDDLFERKY
jgi:hypothetical protein